MPIQDFPRFFVALLISGVAGAATETAAIRPGETWLDDHGVAINAHGGGLLFHEGVYFWFGEHKVAGGAGNRAQVGVHVYASTDLYHWKDAGIALAVSDDPASEIVRGCILERPKVIFNARTGKFVMWFHLELKSMGYKAARSGVAVADKPAGPYTYLRSLRPDAGAWPINATGQQKAELKEAEKLIKFLDQKLGTNKIRFFPLKLYQKLLFFPYGLGVGSIFL